MAKTRFEQAHFDFSTKAHVAATQQFYPMALETPKEHLEFEDVTATTEKGKLLDLQMGIDRVIHVKGIFKEPVILSVQERFRKGADLHKKDKHGNEYGNQITITEWNNPSNLPSELYKLYAHLFVYGFYDAQQDRIIKAVMVNVPLLIMGLINARIPVIREVNPKSQTFVAINEQDLIRARALFYTYENGKGSLINYRSEDGILMWIRSYCANVDPVKRYRLCQDVLSHDGIRMSAKQKRKQTAQNDSLLPFS